MLYVPRNVQIELPLHGVTAGRGGVADFAHTLIIAEENSQVTYVDDLISEDDGAAFHSGVVEIFARPGAVVRYCTARTGTPTPGTSAPSRLRCSATPSSPGSSAPGAAG